MCDSTWPSGISCRKKLPCAAFQRAATWPFPVLCWTFPAKRPNAVILGYPVVTAGQYAHRGSFVQLAGSADPAAQQVFGLEDKITPQTPPVFVWTTMEDATVPVENTLMLVNALHRAGVPCEAHLFEKGVHGTSISTAEVDQPSRHRHHWVELAVEWLGDTFAFSVC